MLLNGAWQHPARSSARSRSWSVLDRRHEISPRHQWFREIGKTHPDANVAAWLNSVDDADLAISALTVREVRKGIVKLAAKKPDVAAQIEARVHDF